MNIKLLAATPNAKRVAFAAIRSCYSPLTAYELFTTEFDKYEAKIVEDENHCQMRDSDRLMRQIVSSGHTSTLEHIIFTFSIEGISRACLAQLTRHRIASYSVQSQRYVKQNSESKHGKARFIVPDLTYLEKQDDQVESRQIIDQTLAAIQTAYDELIAHGVKAEDARAILPQCSDCNLTMTMNLRSLLNFYKLRNKTTHAQKEIQDLAEEIRKTVVAAEPWTDWFFDNVLNGGK